jgi:hypothetical protein
MVGVTIVVLVANGSAVPALATGRKATVKMRSSSPASEMAELVT